MAVRINVAMWCLRSPCAHLRYLRSHHLTKALRAAIGAAMIAMRIFPRHHRPPQPREAALSRRG
jgi:hypothetical protein